MTTSVGRSILAGCQRSQTIARAYTNKSVDKLRGSYGTGAQGNTETNGIRVYHHVDDLTQMMWHLNPYILASIPSRAVWC